MAVIDWFIIAGYFVLVIGVGVLSGKGVSSDKGFFLGGRKMPAWAVAMSFAATTLSAVTFIGGPEFAYRNDLTVLVWELGKVLGALFVAFLFLPALYRAGTVTVYGYLGQHVGPGASKAASLVFLFGRLLASGARLFAAGTAFSLILYGNLEQTNLITAIIVFGIVGTLYTTLGGIKAVIWTDALQLVVVIGALLGSMLLLLDAIPLSMGEILQVVESEGKTKVLDVSADPSNDKTLWAAIALTIFFAAAFGTDQDMAQRLLTCKSAKQAIGSLLGATVIALPITVLFMVTGLLLFVFYDRPDVMGAAAPAQAAADGRQVYPQFLLHELPVGLRGLAMAGLFAAAMSSLDSVINAMASSFTNDLVRPIGKRLGLMNDQPTSDEQAGGWLARLTVVLMGVLLTKAAIVMVLVYDPQQNTLYTFAVGVMAFAYAGLMGVFVSVLLLKRGSTASVIAALIIGPAIIYASRELPILVNWGLAWPYWMVIASAASGAVCAVSGRLQNQ